MNFEITVLPGRWELVPIINCSSREYLLPWLILSHACAVNRYTMKKSNVNVIPTPHFDHLLQLFWGEELVLLH